MSDTGNCAVCVDGMHQPVIENERFTMFTNILVVQCSNTSDRLSPHVGARLICMQYEAAGYATNYKTNPSKVLRAPSDWDDEWHSVATSARAQ